jgi:RNA polymerase sigma factor (sigma-70 family)
MANEENAIPPEEAPAPGSKLPPEEINRLTSDNVKLAYWFAARHRRLPGQTEDDVQSQAIHGLVKAANTYDPSKGKFPAYASQIIRNYLGHLNYKTGEKNINEPTSLDAPIGGEEGEGGDDSMHDKYGDPTTKAAGKEADQSEASRILNDEINRIPEPTKSMVRRWMNGESYRDMQSDFGISFMQIRNRVTAAMGQIKASLASKGIINLQDIWPESMETDEEGAYGKFICECLLSQIEASTALQQISEQELKAKLTF